MNGFDDIERRYGVRYKRGMRVTVDGDPGTITSADSHLRVRFDGSKRPLPCHPTWKVEITSTDQNAGSGVMATALVIMTCKRDMHTWARVGQREGNSISLGTITEPGGKDDPTICPQCGGREIAMSILAEPRKKRTKRTKR